MNSTNIPSESGCANIEEIVFQIEKDIIRQTDTYQILELQGIYQNHPLRKDYEELVKNLRNAFKFKFTII